MTEKTLNDLVIELNKEMCNRTSAENLRRILKELNELYEKQKI